MSTADFVSRFTPSFMPPDVLEAIFVQRHALAERLVALIRESALTAAKHHTLLVGSRGIGKTHLISLLHNRVKAMADLQPKLLIAWLQEDEWGIDSFLELLRKILLAIRRAYSDDALGARIDGLTTVSPEEAERTAAHLLREYAGGRTVLVLMENLDEIFAALGTEGQQRLRAYLQEDPFITILASSPSLFGGVSLQTSPFYGFFRPVNLEGLTPDEAAELLTRIAQHRGNTSLAEFIGTPTGRARLRAIRHLAGGNHRVYVLLSQFLTREGLDELVQPFMRTLDDLTPYYQSRMKELEPAQRKIVEYLCERRGAAPATEIAAQCFLSGEVTRQNLRVLAEKGYITVHQVKREPRYELREPLMRMCLDVKKQRGEPIRLFIDFLRIWYSRKELEERFTQLPEEHVERDYLAHALQLLDVLGDEVLRACLRDVRELEEIADYESALRAADDLSATRGNAFDWTKKGLVLVKLDRYADAGDCFKSAIEKDPTDYRASGLLAAGMLRPGRFEEAQTWAKLSIEHSPATENSGWEQRIRGIRSVALMALEKFDEGSGELYAALTCAAEDDFEFMPWLMIWLIRMERELSDETFRSTTQAIYNSYKRARRSLFLTGMIVSAFIFLKDQPKARIHRWVSTWSAASDNEDFALARKLLHIGERYLDTADPAVLLDLAVEERELLERALKIAVLPSVQSRNGNGT